MNIFILSNIGKALDEGQRNVATHLSNELSKRHNVYHVNARENVFSKKFWKTLKRSEPDIIHIFLRPNISTFIYGKILKGLCRGAKTVISALQPPLNPYLAEAIIPFLKPDLVLTLSDDTARLFASLGCNTAFLDCGVNSQKFVPVDEEKKRALRKKYGIEKDKFVILHVGSITAGRNLLDMVDIQNNKDNNQILVVTNTTFTPDSRVYKELKESGCIILQEYFEHIEEIYQLADCYLFPTLNKSACIELPLSILEAMACNLPVITTRFGALPRVFSEGEGLRFIDNKDDIHLALKKIKYQAISIKTREKVISHTWEKVARNLERIYTVLLDKKR